SGGTGGPLLATVTRAVGPPFAVVTSTQPPERLCATAFSTRLATSRSSSAGSPRTTAGASAGRSRMSRSAAAAATRSSALAAEPPQHAVAAVGQVLQLVPRSVQLDALVQVRHRQPAGGARDVPEGLERPAGEQPAEPARGHRHQRDERAPPPQQAAQGV